MMMMMMINLMAYTFLIQLNSECTSQYHIYTVSQKITVMGQSLSELLSKSIVDTTFSPAPAFACSFSVQAGM